jgi:iron complex transport system ATP-binding protein
LTVTFDHVSVTLGGRAVLRDVSAALLPGRVTAILGPNGAGKSTLLKAACALLPIAGTVWLREDDVAAMEPRERACEIGYLPQDAVVAWNMRARDVVALGRLPHRTSPAEDAAAIDRALDATDTRTFADRAILTLSGGERARVLLARVLAGDPHILLADEPLASLDPAHQFALLDLLRAQAVAGKGVGIVMHDLAHAARIADDVLLLDRGELVASGPADDVLTPNRIARVFGVVARRIDGALVLDGPVSR